MRRSRIPGTFKGRDGQIPKCQQCLNANRIPLWLPGVGKHHVKVNGDEHVVRFMGAWACRIHYKIEVKGKRDPVMLKDLFVNRAHRRGLLGRARVKQT